MTFLDGARWDVASKITVSVNKNSGEVLKKTAGWKAAETVGAKKNRGELEKNNWSELNKNNGRELETTEYNVKNGSQPKYVAGRDP